MNKLFPSAEGGGEGTTRCSLQSLGVLNECVRWGDYCLRRASVNRSMDVYVVHMQLFCTCLHAGVVGSMSLMKSVTTLYFLYLVREVTIPMYR